MCARAWRRDRERRQSAGGARLRTRRGMCAARRGMCAAQREMRERRRGESLAWAERVKSDDDDDGRERPRWTACVCKAVASRAENKCCTRFRQPSADAKMRSPRARGANYVLLARLAGRRFVTATLNTTQLQVRGRGIGVTESNFDRVDARLSAPFRARRAPFIRRSPFTGTANRPRSHD